MRISLPPRAYGAAPVLLAVLAGVLLALALPAGARAAEACPNEQLRRESNVNPTTGQPYDLDLPECRAYEMVTPLDKEGHDVEMGSGVLQSPTTAEGNAVGFVTLGEFAGAEGGNGSLRSNNYSSHRTSSGWTTRSEYIPAPIAPFALSISLETGVLYNSDLSSSVECGETGEGTRITEPAVVCGLHEPNGEWLASPIFPKITSSSGSVGSLKKYGASNDLSHIVFNLGTGETLLASDTAKTGIGSGGAINASGLYELAGLGTGGPVTLRLVNVDNNNVEIGSTVPELGDSVLGTVNDGSDYHAVSEDGETIYFEAHPAGGVQTLYARLHAANTVAISEPSTVDCAECQTGAALQKEAFFQGASADGSKVFFTTEQELFAGHTTNNLYEFDFNAPAGHRLSIVTSTVAKGEVQGVLRNSGDGSHVYFVAKSVLTTTPNAQSQEAQPGADNLYAYERDSTYPAGRTMFITALCSAQDQSGSTADTKCSTPGSNDAQLWNLFDGQGAHHEAIPRDGDYLAFETYAHLLPEDQNEAPGIYRYDALTGELTWVSHAAPGFTAANEKDASSIPSLRGNSDGSLPDVESDGRAISEDGSDIIFSTPEKLQADDVNKLNDVYLWHNGTVSLISGGQDASGQGADTGLGSDVVTSPNMSADGSNIFFTVRSQLVGQDIDGNTDVYDARVDGGFPAPVPSVECAQKESGEACQGPLAALPSFAAAATATFTGGANLASPAEVKPSITPPPAPKPAVLTRAQKLAQALKACKTDKAQKKRAACEAKARRQYGGRAKAKARGGSKAKPNSKTEKSNRRGI